MGTEILKSFGTLQSELEQAKDSLKGVDENIKRLIGRDPSDIPPRPGAKRGASTDDRNRQRVSRNRDGVDEPVNKRRAGVSVFKRLDRQQPSAYEMDDLHPQPHRLMISKVIVTPKELPSRQEALAAQSKDEQSKARNRRMFGALLGTLQKFQQEETKLKQKEDKRAQLEKKIEEHEIKEKEEIKKERQELFFNRKKKQAEIKMIELKMMRMKEYAAWEERQKPRMNFIQTKAKPHIHYLPRKLTETTKKMLEECRNDVEKMIDKKRQEVFDELQQIEERMKKNFDGKKSKNVKKGDDANGVGEEEEEDEQHLPKVGVKSSVEYVSSRNAEDLENITIKNEKENDSEAKEQSMEEEISESVDISVPEAAEISQADIKKEKTDATSKVEEEKSTAPTLVLKLSDLYKV